LTAGRFKFEVHRARFIAGRGLLRRILGQYLSFPPETLRFEYSEFGKPHLPDNSLFFNVAHSEHRFLAAIASGPVGVDIELLRPFPDIESVAGQVFSPAELTHWTRLAPESKPDHFLALWTRKEALLKGIGLGIAHHLKHVSVFFDNGGEIIIPPELAKEEWTVETFSDGDAIWSVAAPFTNPTINRYQYSSSAKER